MAQRGIREFDAKRLLHKHLPAYSEGQFSVPGERLLVTSAADFEEKAKTLAWLQKDKLVLKPDQLIGKKAKNQLMALGVSLPQATEFLKNNLGKDAEVGGLHGKLTHYLVEPFVPHEREYYVALLTEREADVVLFSPEGGVDIEEKWNTVQRLEIPVNGPPELRVFEELVAKANAPAPDRAVLARFLRALHAFFSQTGFSYLELNPFALVKGKPVPLGAVARLDDTSAFEHVDTWGGIEFPTPFGREPTREEAFVKQLDEKTGASLKLTVLNPTASIWPLVAGGGASVVYADAVVAAGKGRDLAVYGEYSGDPNEELTFQYARTVLKLMVQSPAPRKALLVGGGIANFTNVAATFTGIVKAIEENADAMRKANVKVFVRRGGPNYKQGLEMMKSACERLKLPVEVNGPETPMTNIVARGVAWIDGKEPHERGTPK